MERFLDYFEPKKYVLDLGVDKRWKKIGGWVTVTGVAKAQKIKFHAVGIEVKQVLINGKNWDFRQANGVLTLNKVPLGDLEVVVGYDGSLNENMQGAYVSTYELSDLGAESREAALKGSDALEATLRGNNGKTDAAEGTKVDDSNSNDGGGTHVETMVATQFESHYAREAFPCIDEPGAKAVFELSLTVPEMGDTVIANTPVKAKKTYSTVPDGKYTVFYNENGKKSAPKYTKYEFEPTPRMSTYLLAWVIGRMHGKSVKNAHGVKITTYCALNQPVESVDFANEIAAKSLEFYDDNFGVKYPLKKLDQVALPDFEAGAMENWGLVTYRESMMLAGETATLGTRKSVALTVAHELSHQWFGDLVTMGWWDDLWLNESFASVMEYYAVDHIHPEYRIFENFFTGDCLAALRRDALSGVQSVHQEVSSPEEIATLFDPAIVYAKGARLMLMVVRAMGWEKFCAGLKDYFEKFKYANTVGDDLWGSLAPYAEFDVEGLMHAFIGRPGYPVVTRVAAGGGTSEYFALPKTEFGEVRQTRFLLDAPMKGASDWPLPELREDMSGHYIFNLDEVGFNERLEKFDALSLEEKLRLLIDRSLVCKTDLAESGSLVPLLWKFREEKSAAVWNIIATVIKNLRVFFEFGSEEELKFKKWVGELVAPGISRVGFATRADDDENTVRLRAVLLALDFYAEDEKGLGKLAKEYDEVMGDDAGDVSGVGVDGGGDDAGAGADGVDSDGGVGEKLTKLSRLDPELRENILDAKIWMDAEAMDEYIEMYEATSDPEVKFDLLIAMTLARDVEALHKAMRLLGDIETVKPQDQFYLFIFLYQNPRVREEVFAWLRENWATVREYSGDKSMDNYPRHMAAAIKTTHDYEGYREFFDGLRDDLTVARAIEMGMREIEATLRLIETDRTGVYRELGV